MLSSDLVSSFAEIAREKGIERDLLQLIVEDVFRAMIRKRYGADEAFEIIFNPDHGDIQILHIREVVPNMDLEDPVTEIEAKDAVLIDEDDWKSHGYQQHSKKSSSQYLQINDLQLALSHDLEQHEKMLVGLRSLMSNLAECHDALGRIVDSLWQYHFEVGQV